MTKNAATKNAPDADAVKAALIVRIGDVIRVDRFTQAEAAKPMGVSQVDVSRLIQGQVRFMSVERLFKLLSRLDCALEIFVEQPHMPAFAPIRMGD